MKKFLKWFLKGWLDCIVAIACIMVVIVCVAGGWSTTIGFLGETLVIHILSILIIACIGFIKEFIGGLKNGKNM